MRRVSERQRDVLDFIAKMTVVLRFHLEEHFGPGVGYDLKKLLALRLLRRRRYSGRHSLYQATAAATHLLGVPESRARALGAQAIHQKVCVGHLVTVLGYRLLSREKTGEIVDAPPGVSFVLGHRAEGSVLFRVLTPGGYADPRGVVRAVRRLEETRDKALFHENEFGYLITADSPARKAGLSAALKRAKLYGQGFALRVELAPSAATIQDFTHECATEAGD